jgi:cardiolipin synthase (CMP-forming)
VRTLDKALGSASNMGWRLFHLGGHRSEEYEARQTILSWANGLTTLRLLCLPLFVYLVVARKEYVSSFALLWALAVMDVLDGYLARRLDQVTKIGTALDPIVDRITVATLCIAFILAKAMPLWLCCAIVGRDIILVACLAIVMKGRMPIAVTRAGKLGTLSIFIGVPCLLIDKIHSNGWAAFHYCVALVIIFGIAMYYVSLFQYLRASAAVRGVVRQ